MTCLMGERWPGRRGTTLPEPTSCERPKPSSAATMRVYRSSPARVRGGATDERVPTIIEPTYFSGAAGSGFVGSGWPGPAFGPAPRPFALVTHSRPAASWTEVGYQAVGIS